MDSTQILSNKKILVVDDEALLRETIADLFRSRGASVLEANCGPSGIELIESQGPFDLVLSDMRMPKGGADYILNRLTDRTRPKVFLILTGFSDQESSELIKMGANEVLSKPFESKELISRVVFWLQQKCKE
jgi:two-component system response regulator